MAAPDRTTVFQKYYMLIYIEPLIVAIHMPKEWDSLRTGETLVRLFKFPRHVCKCGHNKDYHVNGKTRCVFGICDCKSFRQCPVR